MSRSRRGGTVAAVLAGIAIVIAAGVVLAGVTAWLLARNVRVSERAGETRVETPFGSVRVREQGPLDADALGMPVYPGAARVEDSRKMASFELDFGATHKDMRVAVAEYETRDPIGKVEEFYRERLPDARTRRKHGDRLIFEWGSGDVKRVAALRTHGGGVRITLASFAEAAAN